MLQTFIESLRVYVRGGTGGHGLPKYNGIGGKGGDIFVVGEKEATLKRILSLCPTKRFSAPTGEDSRYAIYLAHIFMPYAVVASIGKQILK